MTDISVIIVNYGTADLTIEAVESVRARAHGGRSVDIHLVDNASVGDDAALLTQAHADRGWGDQVTLYLERENHGFGRGNNLVLRGLAARQTPPRYVFLLNPDAQLDNETIDTLAKALDDDPQVAAVGASITLPSGKPVTAAYRFPSPASEFLRAANLGPLSKRFARYMTALPADHPAGPVDWVSGACVMFRMSALQEVEFFDPTFFLYFEELDLMRRIRTKGYEVLYCPAAKIIHVEGAATQVKSGRAERRPKPAYWYASWRIYFTKAFGRAGALWAAACWIAGSVLNLILAVLMRRKRIFAPERFYRDVSRIVIGPLLIGKKETDGKS